jgi:tetratricopeptide (TPR) repeat protein
MHHSAAAEGKMRFIAWTRALAFGVAAILLGGGPAAASDFTNALRGVWDGTYCGGDSTTNWVIDTTPTRAWAHEHWCNGFTCGDVDYRITALNDADDVVQFTPYYAPGWSVTGYTVVMHLSNSRLDGQFYNHPRCDDIHLQRSNSVVIGGPLQWSSAAPLPGSTGGGGQSYAAAALSWDDCVSQDLNLRIRACTGIIESGQVQGAALATAYGNRGAAYGDLVKPESVPGCDNYDTDLANLNNAVADFQQSLRVDSSTGDVKNELWLTLEQRADCQTRHGHRREAIADYTLSFNYAPPPDTANGVDETSHIYESRGWSYYWLGDDAHAMADFTEALRRDAAVNWTNDADRFYDRGHVHLTRGEFAAAIADFSEAVSREEHSSLRNDTMLADYYYSRGIAERGNANDAAGNADIQHAKTLNPEVADRFPGFHD